MKGLSLWSVLLQRTVNRSSVVFGCCVIVVLVSTPTIVRRISRVRGREVAIGYRLLWTQSCTVVAGDAAVVPMSPLPGPPSWGVLVATDKPPRLGWLSKVIPS